MVVEPDSLVGEMASMVDIKQDMTQGVFEFENAIDAFCLWIVVGIAHFAHAGNDVNGSQGVAIVVASVLDTVIAMVNQVGQRQVRLSNKKG